MKAYILYIATLLAALALPATAQNGPDTKAAPGKPAMPYRLTSTLTDAKHGTVLIETTKPGSTTGAFAPLTADSIAYGSPDTVNTATVRLSITPDANYQVRNSFPKVYKTNDTAKTPVGNLTAGADISKAKVWTFVMPAHPVTVEMAYATPITKVPGITLRKETTTVADALASLPAYIPITLASGHADSLRVATPAGWVFTAADTIGTGPYNPAPGAVNRFTATLAANALPDSIAPGSLLTTAGQTYTVTLRVTNKTVPLTPSEPDKGLVVSGGTDDDNLNGSLDSGDKKPFNGTIENAEVKTLEIQGDVQGATLTLSGLTVSGNNNPTDAHTDIRTGADLTLRLEGTNSLGTLTVEDGATVVLSPTTDAKLENTTVSNAGTFRDSTALITSVTGTGALSINGTLAGGGSVTQGNPVTLTATTTDKAGTTSFIWQQLGADGSYTTITTNRYDENGTALPSSLRSTSGSTPAGITDNYQPATSATGAAQYRCLISRETANAVTLLSTKSETVTVTEVTDPEPTPVYYEITLPQITGATISPIGGVYTVKENQDFGFDLVLDKEYDQSKPIVTTSRGETLEKDSYYGEYRIINVNANITVTVTGIVKNSTVGNEDIGNEDTQVWAADGQLHIRTLQPQTIHIYTYAGSLLRKQSLPGGDSVLPLATGQYLVTVGKVTYKISL